MSLIFPTLIALAASAAFVVIAIAMFRRSRSQKFPPVMLRDGDDDSRALLRSARSRMRRAIVISTAVTFGVVILPIDRWGTALMVAPGIGVVAGLAFISAAPLGRRSRWPDVRHAALAPRQTASFGPRWGFLFPIVTVSSLALFLLVTAATASVDSFGLSRSITVTSEIGSHSSGPYPGWFYALPLLIIALLIIAATLLSVYRIASAPARGTAETAMFEAAARRSLTKFSLMSATAVIVFYLGAIAMTAGTAIRSASQWTALKPEYINDPSKLGTPPVTGDFLRGVVQPQFAAASTEVLVGLVLIIFAFTLVLLAVEVAVRGPITSRATPDNLLTVSA